MLNASRRGFNHEAADNKEAHNSFIEIVGLAGTSPNVGTAGKFSRVSASCYRRLFAYDPSRICVTEIGEGAWSRKELRMMILYVIILVTVVKMRCRGW